MHIWLYLGSHSEESLLESVTTAQKFEFPKYPSLSNEGPEIFREDQAALCSWLPVRERSTRNYVAQCQDGDSRPTIVGYSGTVAINGGDVLTWLAASPRSHIVNEEVSGQFAVFEFSAKGFLVRVDCLGHHKVFYGKSKDLTLVSNYLPLLAKVGSVGIDWAEAVKQNVLINDVAKYCTYQSSYKGIDVLPEFGSLAVSEGRIETSQYRGLQTLWQTGKPYHDTVSRTVTAFQNAASALRGSSSVVVPLSGGYDSRVASAMFWKTTGKPLTTMTYNRQQFFDYGIAAILSHKLGFENIRISITEDDAEDFFLSSQDEDIFDWAWRKKTSSLLESGPIKLVITGNGGDTDWTYKFCGHLKTILQSQKEKEKIFRDFAKVALFSETHPLLLNADFAATSIDSLEGYLFKKYGELLCEPSFFTKFSSAIFHLERWRGQGLAISQRSLGLHDVYAPFGSESFLNLVFNSSESQLQRANRDSIHHLLYKELTGGVAPLAPVLDECRWYGQTWWILNECVHLLSKVAWKVRGGDINTRLRKRFAAELMKRAAWRHQKILDSPSSPVWNILNRQRIEEDLKKKRQPKGISIQNLAQLIAADRPD